MSNTRVLACDRSLFILIRGSTLGKEPGLGLAQMVAIYIMYPTRYNTYQCQYPPGDPLVTFFFGEQCFGSTLPPIERFPMK